MSLLLLPLLPAAVTSQRDSQPAGRCGTRVWVTTMAAAVVSLVPAMPLAAQQRQQPAKDTMITISNRGGVPSVNAADSPLGRYVRQVEGEIGRLWHANRRWRKDTPPGRVVITFWVTKKGKVEGVVIDDQKHSSPLLNEISLLAIKGAKIPPMPQEVCSELSEFEPDRRRFDMSFNILDPAKPLAQQQPPAGTRRSISDSNPKGNGEAASAVDAEARDKDTPKERFTRLVEEQVAKKWHSHLADRRDAAPGMLEVTAYVTPQGKVEGVTLNDSSRSNVILNEVAVRALKTAEIPPMPADVVAELPEKPGVPAGRLRCDFNFVIEAPLPEKKKKPQTPATAETSKTTAAGAEPEPAPEPEPEPESWQQWLAEQKPLKQYYSQVGELLQQEWKRHLTAHRREMPQGELRMSFRLKPDGAVDDVLILDKDAPIRLKNAGLTVLRATVFPPMPAKAVASFAGKPQLGVRVPCTFVVRGAE